MKTIDCKGKHAELCRAIAERRNDDAMQLIYAFFRSEENTDSYSESLLTIVRELMEDGDSDELYRLRIRMRSSGDRVLLNLAQFVWALDTGGFETAAETLAEKCLSDLPKLKRSMQEYLDEEGFSRALEVAGMRIRESIRILHLYFEAQDREEDWEMLDETGLEMTRIFLFDNAPAMSEDMMKAARTAEKKGDTLRCLRLSREIVEAYGHVLDDIMQSSDFSRENYETLESVRFAYKKISALDPEHPYLDRLKAIEEVLLPK